ncbi:hypothetical protein ACFPTO_22020 [Paraburkholderia denitrificans]|uniref:ESPR domain-containing protein n=1 Tax=Paraburkholderia denitrificans TaxID=694025 RepID=A0ABW0JG02_9BURK
MQRFQNNSRSGTTQARIRIFAAQKKLVSINREMRIPGKSTSRSPRQSIWGGALKWCVASITVVAAMWCPTQTLDFPPVPHDAQHQSISITR